MQKYHEDEGGNTVDIETGEESEENVDTAAAQVKLKALREKLKICEQEKAEHLTGWQRAKADLVNYKREVAADYDRERKRAAEDVVTDLLSVVDSFGMAMKGQAWQNVDANWRTGVEYIHAQLMNVLKDHGLETFGKVGERFDPNIHESVSTSNTEQEDDDHTVHEIIQPGFTLHSKVIRPAKVVVAVYNADHDN
jgi:molecular chaperone GrpE